MIRILMISPALAMPVHEWYPSSCCGGKDCHPTPCEDLVENADGDWMYVPMRRYLSKDQVSLSHDSRCHVCIVPARGVGAPRLVCAFVLSGV
jgi:hypothetical protein